MKLAKVSLLILSVNAASAFHSSPVIKKRTAFRCDTEMYSEKKPLTSADILARARAAVGAPEEAEGPKMEYPFEQDLLDEFQTILQILEKRVINGPGSISSEEINKFEAISGRIVDEMDDVIQKRAAKSGGQDVSQSPPTSSRPVDVSPIRNSQVSDNPNDEPDFDGKYGLPTGTANTYIIPGMNEMTPEEYRAALQKTVIERQGRRKTGRGGIVGNRAAHDYLSTLGYGGTSKALSRGRDADDE